jgi:hypothetical protein
MPEKFGHLPLWRLRYIILLDWSGFWGRLLLLLAIVTILVAVVLTIRVLARVATSTAILIQSLVRATAVLVELDLLIGVP